MKPYHKQSFPKLGFIKVPPLPDPIVLCAIVRRTDVLSRKHVQIKVVNISTF